MFCIDSFLISFCTARVFAKLISFNRIKQFKNYFQILQSQYHNESLNWIFLKTFHIHLNIQRLNIGGFTGDEKALLDNLDSFQGLNLKLWDYKICIMVLEFRNIYVDLISLNLQSSVNRRRCHTVTEATDLNDCTQSAQNWKLFNLISSTSS